MTSRNQGLSPNDKGRQRRESLGTMLPKSKGEQFALSSTGFPRVGVTFSAIIPM